MVNTSVSSELPYKQRIIEATLNSKTEVRVIESPVENTGFFFDQLKQDVTSYPLLLIFVLSDNTGTRTCSNITSATINIHHNNGHHQFFSHFLLLLVTIFSTVYHNV